MAKEILNECLECLENCAECPGNVKNWEKTFAQFAAEKEDEEEDLPLPFYAE